MRVRACVSVCACVAVFTLPADVCVCVGRLPERVCGCVFINLSVQMCTPLGFLPKRVKRSHLDPPVNTGGLRTPRAADMLF